MHKLTPTVLLANFRTSMYRERNDRCRSPPVMNSSGGNIPGQMQVPMEDSPMDVAGAAKGRRCGCNQRDDNQYYRVNPSHAVDLRGIIPGGSICDENKRPL